jgi:mRNA interferase RelE/StbE
MDIHFSKTSLKYLAKRETKVRSVLLEAIEGLPDNGDIRRLKGQVIKNTYRLRVGRYRVIYIFEEDVIRILDIDTRGDVYK